MSLTDAYQIAGIVSATVAFVGLIVLWVYAYDTRKLRLVAQQQLEAPITPCVVVTGNPQNKGLDGPLRFENLGVGVALNIGWRYASSPTTWIEVPALSLRDTHHAPFVIRDILNHGKAIICEFDSLSGTRYTTTSSIPEDTREFDFQHHFKQYDFRVSHRPTSASSSEKLYIGRTCSQGSCASPSQSHFWTSPDLPAM
jgi:hypothetical protein